MCKKVVTLHTHWVKLQQLKLPIQRYFEAETSYGIKQWIRMAALSWKSLLLSLFPDSYLGVLTMAIFKMEQGMNFNGTFVTVTYLGTMISPTKYGRWQRIN